MASRKTDGTPSPVDAVQAVYAALEPLDDPTRQKVLASVTALLGMVAPVSSVPRVTVAQAEETRGGQVLRAVQPERPKSLVELIQDKRPSTNTEKIALFAYYRERVEGLSRFSRGDLKQYFSVAKEKPAANYDRDFSKAIKAGWVHEDGADSYLTSRGLEAVESGFASSSASDARSSQKPPAKRPKSSRQK